MVFDWSNRMIGSDDPEYQVEGADPGEAAMELFAYADELCGRRSGSTPTQDLVSSVLTQAEIDGDQLDQLELDLFFLLLIVAGNETTRNLISGAMVAFFDHPDQWERLRPDRSSSRRRVEEMLRFVTPVMHFRRTVVADTELGDQALQEGDKIVFWHISANRDESVFTDPDTFDIARSPNNHMAFGGGGPHFCLGANLARMEIMVMFDRLLDRIPDIRLDGEVQRLQSNFINGVEAHPGGLRAVRTHRRYAVAGPGRLSGVPQTDSRASPTDAPALPSIDHLPAHPSGRAAGPGQRRAGLRRHLHLGPPLQPPRLESRYTYSKARGRRARLGEGDAVAGSDVPDLRPVRRSPPTHLHHRRLHRPGPRPHHRGQVGRHRRRPVRQPGSPRRRRGLVQGGVRPDRTGLQHPGQAARRDDPGPAGAVAGRLGRIPRHLLRRARRAR